MNGEKKDFLFAIQVTDKMDYRVGNIFVKLE